jgi:2-keto-4-pentenoate hydratase/2-oxohepta-3-ene-1,7-dioic acid hydratase in catechol pathway
LLTRATPAGERLVVAAGDDASVDVDDLLGGGPWTLSRLLDDPGTTLTAIDAALGRTDPLPARAFADVELLAPVTRPGKIVAVGRNYREHAAEEGATAPPDPILFAKFPNAVIGGGSDITWRASDTAQVDYEAELGVVIGRRARDVPLARALDHVLGYTCVNDVSARDLQFADGQWTRGKSLDTFCPIGPWIVTADAIPDPAALRLRCLVNGEILQDAMTSEMIHDIPHLIAFCSRFVTLEPGDVIATGTPGGVGVFRKPPRFLGDGDEVVVDIDGVGRLVNRCRVLDA